VVRLLRVRTKGPKRSTHTGMPAICRRERRSSPETGRFVCFRGTDIENVHDIVHDFPLGQPLLLDPFRSGPGNHRRCLLRPRGAACGVDFELLCKEGWQGIEMERIDRTRGIFRDRLQILGEYLKMKKRVNERGFFCPETGQSWSTLPLPCDRPCTPSRRSSHVSAYNRPRSCRGGPSTLCAASC